MMEEERLLNPQDLQHGGEEAAMDDGWLQLGIGSQKSEVDHRLKNEPRIAELELMPSNSSSQGSQFRLLSRSPEFLPPQAATTLSSITMVVDPSSSTQNTATSSFVFPHHQRLAGGVPISIGMDQGSNFRLPLQLVNGLNTPARGGYLDFKVVQPPRRPHSGLWFTLLPSPNQEKDAFLQQISRRYFRIKDGRMTISVVIKYLIKRLKLETELEVEIRCKGQKLEPSLTLQHVRDYVWSKSPKESITLLPNSSATHHIMVLHYGLVSTNQS